MDVVEMVKEMIDEIQQDGSKVVLVYSPFYIEGQKKIDNIEQVVDSFQAIADERRCLFLNYLNDSINYDSTLFKNAVHLNSTGADLFSAKLGHDLDSLIW